MFYIRDAHAQDLSLIVDFQMKMALETESLQLNASTLEQGVRAVFDQPEKGRYFMAETDNRVCGSMLITYEWSDWRNSTVWWLQSVYVLPQYRRKGVFAAMYGHAKAIVKGDSALSGLRLYVDRNNLPAQKTYQSLGMDGNHYKVYEWMK